MFNTILTILLLFATLVTPALHSAEREVRIVGGAAVPDLRYPWMTSIYFREQGSLFLPRCGGSLIADRWILTAAHCLVNSETGQVLNPANVAILVGALDLTSNDGIFEQVLRIVVHPAYNPDTTQNDIALLELSEPVNIEAITIPGPANPVPQDGELSTATGWGLTSEGGTSSAQLLEVDLPIVPHNVCQPFYEGIPNINLDRTTMVCAGGSRFGGKDTCQGDSGGPLFVERNNQFVQAGIVSAGLGCARPGIPGVYTRLVSYFDWISGFVENLKIYDGTGEDDVIAVTNPVELLSPNTRVTATVTRGNTDIYQVFGVNQITLETLVGDADLYVFNAAEFTTETLVCQSIKVETIDECLFTGLGNFFIAVSGYAASEYTLAVSNGAEEIVQSGISTLQLDTPVSGRLLQDTAVVYRATSGNLANLISINGNADLLVFSDSEFIIDNLLCISRATGTQLDSCIFSDQDSEVFLGVFGFTDVDYTLEISNATQEVTTQGGDGNTTDTVDERDSGIGTTFIEVILLLLLIHPIRKHQLRASVS